MWLQMMGVYRYRYITNATMVCQRVNCTTQIWTWAVHKLQQHRRIGALGQSEASLKKAALEPDKTFYVTSESRLKSRDRTVLYQGHCTGVHLSVVKMSLLHTQQPLPRLFVATPSTPLKVPLPCSPDLETQECHCKHAAKPYRHLLKACKLLTCKGCCCIQVSKLCLHQGQQLLQLLLLP
jgi:hypothetical protein